MDDRDENEMPSYIRGLSMENLQRFLEERGFDSCGSLGMLRERVVLVLREERIKKLESRMEDMELEDIEGHIQDETTEEVVNKRLSLSYSPISESNPNKELNEKVMQTAQTFFKEHMSLEKISEANISEAQVADYPVTKQTCSSTSTVTCYTSPIMSSLPSYISNSQSSPIIRQSFPLVNQKHDLSIQELKHNGPNMYNGSSECGAIPKVPQNSSHKSQEVSFSPYSKNFNATKIGQISHISGKLNAETYSQVSTGGMPNDFTNNTEFVGTKFIPNPRNCEAAWPNNNLNSGVQFLGSFTQGLTSKMNDFSPFSNSTKPKLSSKINSHECTCSCGKDILSGRVASATPFAPRTGNIHKNNN